MSIWGPRLEGARFLDLFAGSGAVGFEALSRGAESTMFVERDPLVLSELRQACARLALQQAAVVEADLPAEVAKVARTEAQEFTLIFADPPYGFTAYVSLLESVTTLLESTGELVVEHAPTAELPEQVGDLERWSQRRYGDSSLSFYRHRG